MKIENLNLYYVEDALIIVRNAEIESVDKNGNIKFCNISDSNNVEIINVENFKSIDRSYICESQNIYTSFIDVGGDRIER